MSSVGAAGGVGGAGRFAELQEVAAELGAPSGGAVGESKSAAEAGVRSVAAEAAGASGLRGLVGQALHTGRATAKSGGPEGTESLLGRAHAQKAERLLSAAPRTVLEALERHLARIVGPAADVARALYLKAATARLGPLTEGPFAKQEAALSVLGAFAGRLAGMPRDEMLERTTSLDLDSRVSTSAFEPLAWDSDQGRIHEAGMDDARGDNDGLLQRFTGSCGTASLEMMACEEDPVRALAATDRGLQSMDAGDASGVFQELVLRERGSDAFPRRVDHNLARLHNGVGRLVRNGAVPRAEAKALNAYADAKGDLTESAQRALAKLRGLARGFPTDADLAEIRGVKVRTDQGLATSDLQEAMRIHLEPILGRGFREIGGDAGMPEGAVRGHVDALAATLAEGLDACFSITEPGHWMVASAVRGAAPDRDLLVSDPWSGRTAWVTEDDFVSGKFIWSQFELETKEDAGYVDVLVLPETRT